MHFEKRRTATHGLLFAVLEAYTRRRAFLVFWSKIREVMEKRGGKARGGYIYPLRPSKVPKYLLLVMERTLSSHRMAKIVLLCGNAGVVDTCLEIHTVLSLGRGQHAQMLSESWSTGARSFFIHLFCVVLSSYGPCIWRLYTPLNPHEGKRYTLLKAQKDTAHSLATAAFQTYGKHFRVFWHDFKGLWVRK
jgi:hypothetical protein